MPFRVDVGLESACGQREENQDRVAFFDSQFGRVFVLADGMGGHSGGAIASSIAVSNLSQVMQTLPASIPPDEALVQGIQGLNSMILEEAQRGEEKTRQMGSTVVALLLCDTAEGLLAVGAHVGDSRLYFARGQQMFCLTQDHTVVQQLVATGALTSDQAFRHPQASVLTRALGRATSIPVELTSWTMVLPGDVFLLCSDGLSGYADDAAIRKTLLQMEPAEQIARQLVGLAFEKESQDNISVIVIRVADVAPEWTTAGPNHN